MGNLRIQDLSIGDWVQAKQAKVDYDDPDLTPPMKIVAIDNREPKQAYVDLAFDDGVVVHSAFVEDLRPVLITPEILEKNGVPHIINDVWAYDEDYQLSWFENGRTILTNYSNMQVVSFFAKYIHQLQHALRLVGLDKEITL